MDLLACTVSIHGESTAQYTHTLTHLNSPRAARPVCPFRSAYARANQQSPTAGPCMRHEHKIERQHERACVCTMATRHDLRRARLRCRAKAPAERRRPTEPSIRAANSRDTAQFRLFRLRPAVQKGRRQWMRWSGGVPEEKRFQASAVQPIATGHVTLESTPPALAFDSRCPLHQKTATTRDAQVCVPDAARYEEADCRNA
jgi:hypothetical protein